MGRILFAASCAGAQPSHTACGLQAAQPEPQPQQGAGRQQLRELAGNETNMLACSSLPAVHTRFTILHGPMFAVSWALLVVLFVGQPVPLAIVAACACLTNNHCCTWPLQPPYRGRRSPPPAATFRCVCGSESCRFV